jgi:hypothetical protein
MTQNKIKAIRTLVALEPKANALANEILAAATAAKKAGATKAEVREQLQVTLNWSALKPNSKPYNAAKTRICRFLAACGFDAEKGGGRKAIKVSDAHIEAVLNFIGKLGYEDPKAALYVIVREAKNWTME